MPKADLSQKALPFTKKCGRVLLNVPEKYPDRIAKIDAARPADAVTKDVIAAVRALLVAKGMIAAS
jgi:thymidylate kinase